MNVLLITYKINTHNIKKLNHENSIYTNGGGKFIL
jgi:hypothetical protein